VLFQVVSDGQTDRPVHVRVLDRGLIKLAAKSSRSGNVMTNSSDLLLRSPYLLLSESPGEREKSFFWVENQTFTLLASNWNVFLIPVGFDFVERLSVK
jgi:hypothetical protein